MNLKILTANDRKFDQEILKERNFPESVKLNVSYRHIICFNYGVWGLAFPAHQLMLIASDFLMGPLRNSIRKKCDWSLQSILGKVNICELLC